MVGGGVRTGIARPQQRSHRFSTTAGPVVAVRQQRVVTVALLIGRGSVFLVRMCGDQGGVDVDADRNLRARRLQRRPILCPVPHVLPRYRLLDD